MSVRGDGLPAMLAALAAVVTAAHAQDVQFVGDAVPAALTATPGDRQRGKAVLVQPVAFAADLDEVGMVHQAIEKCCSRRRVAK